MALSEKGVLGKPKYKTGTVVYFYVNTGVEVKPEIASGTVEIVDSYGTFEQNEEPSYDVLVEDYKHSGPCLVKHIRESNLTDKEPTKA